MENRNESGRENFIGMTEEELEKVQGGNDFLDLLKEIVANGIRLFTGKDDN